MWPVDGGFKFDNGAGRRNSMLLIQIVDIYHVFYRNFGLDYNFEVI